jgi:hypothetical protein
MKRRFEEFACEFKNESECDEELDDEGAKLSEVDADYFED